VRFAERLDKLGFWNRLALVASALVLAIYPQWWYLHESNRALDLADAGYRTCATNSPAGVFDPITFESITCEAARDLTVARVQDEYAEAWGIMFSLTAIACAGIWGLIWLMTQIAKWVWAGRRRRRSESGPGN
jgi:hypothetical protein